LSVTYTPFGQLLPALQPELLLHKESRRLLQACLRHPAFDVIELRSVPSSGSTGADVIVVECSDGTVPSRNPLGIKNRERLALVYCPTAFVQHQVRALRQGFPVSLHQNHVPPGEPPSLCLYFEPWAAVERNWTPQRHLERILWWLRETALETLHRSDQPLEQLYFEPPYEIVLPPNLDQMERDHTKVLCFYPVAYPTNEPRTFRGVFQAQAFANKHKMPFSDWLVVAPPPVNHGPVETYPSKLGQLHDQLAARGSGILHELCNAIKSTVPETGIKKQGETFTLLLVKALVRRTPEDAPERSDPRVFFIHADLATIGRSCGVLIDGDNGEKSYVDHTAGLAAFSGTTTIEANDWRDIAVEPIGLGMAMTLERARRASGISAEASHFRGVLAGVGALGSVLADLWAREGWGEWTYVDDDYLRPHNVVRHIARDEHIGRSKAEVTKELTNGIFFNGQLENTAIHAKLGDTTNGGLAEVIAQATLIVDATTTLDVPRDVSAGESNPRAASVFLTPSGLSSILLLEDSARAIRLHALEAQYYRAILNSSWGDHHLRGHQGEFWVGAGCRDISAVLSQELIQLHGATLARQLRTLAADSLAQMRVWCLDNPSGALIAHNLPVSAVLISQCGEWTVVWDDGLREKLLELRARGLPNETGGILLGYFDQKLQMLHLVDALSAPLDSEATPNGFSRGKQGLGEVREECLRRTANIVDYVGDWHSHPLGAAALPSTIDLGLIAHLASAMDQDGLPVIMVIVGDKEIGITVGQVTSP